VTPAQAATTVVGYRRPASDAWMALAAIAAVAWDLYWLVGCFR
jgi:hypothetical protein